MFEPRLVYLLAVLSLAAGCGAPPAQMPKGSPAYMDAKCGFRGIAFGTPQSEVVTRLHLRPLDGEPQTLYRRGDEVLRLGSVRLSDIRYRFLRNKFYGVTLIGTASGSPSLLDVVEAAYGRGTCRTSSENSEVSGRRTSKVCAWKGTRVEAEYKENSVELPVFSMWSAALRTEELAHEQVEEILKKKIQDSPVLEAPDDL